MRPDPVPGLTVRHHARKLLAFAGALAAIAGHFVWSGLASSDAKVIMSRERTAQTGWAACSANARTGRASTFRPLSDARAASLVTYKAEDRRFNARPFTVGGKRYAAANYYMPSSAEVQRFHHAVTSTHQSVLRFNPYFVYVDGRDGLRRPSTDELIQWAAHKWGIPEDWLRAEFVQESYWNQWQLGDETSVSSRWYHLYPPQSRVPGSGNVYESLGITQVKWAPNGSVGPCSEPQRWKTTAFNLD